MKQTCDNKLKCLTVLLLLNFYGHLIYGYFNHFKLCNSKQGFRSKFMDNIQLFR